MDKNKLKYILDLFMEDCINEMIKSVLTGSVENPSEEATTAAKLLEDYIEIENEQKKKLAYSDMKGFFNFKGYTPKEFEAFEKCRRGDDNLN